MFPTISRETLQARLKADQPPLLVEALPAAYFRKSHLPHAINIPHDAVDELAPSLLPDKAAEIVVYCANLPCRNSALAAERLVELGYARVSEYAEGKEDWIKAGLPVEAA